MNTNHDPSIISIPKTLLEWADRDTSVGEYARELVGLGARSGDDVTVPDAPAWNRMWCCLEAVVYGAVGAGRADLLTPLPTSIAKELGLKFSWHSADGTCYELGGDGRGRSVSWHGAETILSWSAGDAAALQATRDTMDVLGAKPQRMVEDKPCSKCGKTSAISIDTMDDVRYCSVCWCYLTAPATVRVPTKPKPKPKSRRR